MNLNLLNTRRALLLGSLAVLAGCASVTHIQTGDVTLRDRLVVTVDKAWNQFDGPMSDGFPTWTQDGFNVDSLRFYPGLKDGQLIAPTPSQPAGEKPLVFKSSMSANDALKLFEGLYSRGGSTFTLDRVAPATFAGNPGLRFEWQTLRRSDDARIAGIGWLTVRNGELVAITYTAPRMAFFKRHLASVEAIAGSARLK